MVLDKKSPILFDKALQNLTIIILACPSVTNKSLLFNFFNMNFRQIVETFQKKPFCDVS